MMDNRKIIILRIFFVSIIVGNPLLFSPFAYHYSPSSQLISRFDIDSKKTKEEHSPQLPSPQPLSPEKIDFCNEWADKVCKEKTKSIMINNELLSKAKKKKN